MSQSIHIILDLHWRLNELATNARICGDHEWAEHLAKTILELEKKYNI